MEAFCKVKQLFVSYHTGITFLSDFRFVLFHYATILFGFDKPVTRKKGESETEDYCKTYF